MTPAATDPRCCSCTAGPTTARCGATSSARSPRPAIALSPSTGPSTAAAPTRPASPAAPTPRLTRDTVDLLDVLGVATAHLVAHDYGATVSWEAVAAHPARFRTSTAISVGHSMEVLRDALTGSLLRYHWLLLHGLPVSVPYYSADDARRFRTEFASHPDADAVLHRLQTGDRTFFTAWERADPAPAVVARHLRRRTLITVPTLGLYSRDDERMTEGQMVRSGSRVAAPWRYRLLDGGHWVPLQHPDAITDAVLEFITDHGSSTS